MFDTFADWLFLATLLRAPGACHSAGSLSMEEDLGFGKGHVHPEFDKYHQQWEAEQCRLRDLVVDSDAEPWALDGNDKEGKVPLRYAQDSFFGRWIWTGIGLGFPLDFWPL